MKAGISIALNHSWDKIFEDEEFITKLLDNIIPDYMRVCRWFGGKASTIKQVQIEHQFVCHLTEGTVYAIIFEVLFKENFFQQYFLPLGLSKTKLPDEYAKGEIAPLENSSEQNVWLVDALYLESFQRFIFNQIMQKGKIKNLEGYIRFSRGRKLKEKNTEVVSSRILNADQSNTSIIYNESYFLKIYRRIFRDQNPDLEMVYFLSERRRFGNIPTYLGSITMKRKHSFEISLGLMQRKIENQGDGWNWLLKYTGNYFDRLINGKIDISTLESTANLVPVSIKKLPKSMKDLMDEALLLGIRKLANRTAEMHIHLSSSHNDTAFNPTYYNSDYAVWLKNRLIYQFDARYNLVEKSFDQLTGLAKDYALSFLENKRKIIDWILGFDENQLASRRIRVHNDYHMGQVLVVEDDFYILDFEGEPESTIRDRKVKQSPLKDVAGIFRSFHYAVYATIFTREDEWDLPRKDLFEAGEKFYFTLVSIFLDRYLGLAFDGGLDIGYSNEIEYLLKYNLLEKAIYELGYELNGRPSWAVIPLKGIMQLINEDI